MESILFVAVAVAVIFCLFNWLIESVEEPNTRFSGYNGIYHSFCQERKSHKLNRISHPVIERNIVVETTAGPSRKQVHHAIHSARMGHQVLLSSMSLTISREKVEQKKVLFQGLVEREQGLKVLRDHQAALKSLPARVNSMPISRLHKLVNRMEGLRVVEKSSARREILKARQVAKAANRAKLTQERAEKARIADLHQRVETQISKETKDQESLAQQWEEKFWASKEGRALTLRRNKRSIRQFKAEKRAAQEVALLTVGFAEPSVSLSRQSLIERGLIRPSTIEEDLLPPSFIRKGEARWAEIAPLGSSHCEKKSLQGHLSVARQQVRFAQETGQTSKAVEAGKIVIRLENHLARIPSWQQVGC